MEYVVFGDIWRGFVNIWRICKERNISGVYGFILEFFDCDENVFIVVEVIVGNSLYYVVVDFDDILIKIIYYLSKEKGGRVIFMLLNLIRLFWVIYLIGFDVVFFLSWLRYDL